jgi:[acyl-carrier-protein] S-malonyltransferase
MDKTAYLFAGQGSQYIGMGKDLYEAFPESKMIFDRAEAALGIPLKQYCFEGPAEQLKATNISQPAIVTATIAAFEAYKTKFDIKPDFVAGLSLGEYSALMASGALSFENGIRLIKRRGEIMEEAAKRFPGKMAAIIDLSLDKIREICRESGAEIANLNCPGQTVITGKAEAVLKASQMCEAAGAKRVIALEVSGGFHSSLMTEASLELKAALDRVVFTDPAVPLVGNYDAAPVQDAAAIKQNLVRQIHSSVRWEESVRYILSQGVADFVEFGPGKVLKGLMRKIDSNAQVKTIEKAGDILGGR